MRPEQIPYGVQDFKRIRLEGLYSVDKTAFIRTMEARANVLLTCRQERDVAENGSVRQFLARSFSRG